MIPTTIYVLVALGLWLFSWPHLVGWVIDYREPDFVDYGFAGIVTLLLASLWPVSVVAVGSFFGLAYVGRYLFKKRERRS